MPPRNVQKPRDSKESAPHKHIHCSISLLLIGIFQQLEKLLCSYGMNKTNAILIGCQSHRWHPWSSSYGGMQLRETWKSIHITGTADTADDDFVSLTLPSRGTVHSTQFYMFCTWLSRALHTALLPGKGFPFPLTPTHVFHQHIVILQERFTSYPFNHAHTVIQYASPLPEKCVSGSTGSWNKVRA